MRELTLDSQVSNYLRAPKHAFKWLLGARDRAQEAQRIKPPAGDQAGYQEGGGSKLSDRVSCLNRPLAGASVTVLPDLFRSFPGEEPLGLFA